MTIVKKLCWLTLLVSAIAAEAQTFNMGMETNLPAWNPCVLPLCQPGGSGIPTNVTIAETGTKWPPNALKLSVTADLQGPKGPANLSLDALAALPKKTLQLNAVQAAYAGETAQIGRAHV